MKIHGIAAHPLTWKPIVSRIKPKPAPAPAPVLTDWKAPGGLVYLFYSPETWEAYQHYHGKGWYYPFPIDCIDPYPTTKPLFIRHLK